MEYIFSTLIGIPGIPIDLSHTLSKVDFFQQIKKNAFTFFKVKVF